jgi:hypothetical protein
MSFAPRGYVALVKMHGAREMYLPERSKRCWGGKKQKASEELHIGRADALHWPIQCFCTLQFHETTVTVATMEGWTEQ